MKDVTQSRIQRLLKLIVELKTRPRITRSELLKILDIGKTQLYKDRDVLRSIGVDFSYDQSRKRYTIIETAGLPVGGLTLYERISLIMPFGSFRRPAIIF